MGFLCSFLRRHLAGKKVVASPNVGCFFRLHYLPFLCYYITLLQGLVRDNQCSLYLVAPVLCVLSCWRTLPTRGFSLCYVLQYQFHSQNTPCARLSQPVPAVVGKSWTGVDLVFLPFPTREHQPFLDYGKIGPLWFVTDFFHQFWS